MIRVFYFSNHAHVFYRPHKVILWQAVLLNNQYFEMFRIITVLSNRVRNISSSIRDNL